MGIGTVLGMAVGLGLYLILRGCLPSPVRLADALGALSPRPPAREPATATGGLEGLAERFQRLLRLPLSQRQQRLLNFQGRTSADFFAEKLVWMLAGLLLPGLWAAVQLAFGERPGLVPLGMAAIGAVAGYFVADLRLRGGAQRSRASAIDGIHTFFDLVVLERLANASAAQASAHAAEVAEAPLFRRIAEGLERARMEQVQPWDELRRIAAEWDVTELTDFADVMQLEEQGAGLADVLRARVRELRDAHLSAQKTRAQEASEALSLWMTMPALLLGVALLTPALLTILGGR